MVSAGDAVRVLRLFQAHGIPVWLTGGWGVDALLGEETRSHKDLDVVMLLDDVVRMRDLMAQQGYAFAYLWEENRDAVDGDGVETPTAFVLQDGEGREFDVHAMRHDRDGNGIPAWEAAGFLFTREDLSGTGTIAGYEARCITPESQLANHTGYQLPETHQRDVELLREKFGL